MIEFTIIGSQHYIIFLFITMRNIKTVTEIVMLDRFIFLIIKKTVSFDLNNDMILNHVTIMSLGRRGVV